MKRTEITIETYAVTSVRLGTTRTRFCDACGRTSAVLTIDQTADLLDVAIAEVCREVDEGRMHLVENGRSAALVCGGSISGIPAGTFGSVVSKEEHYEI